MIHIPSIQGEPLSPWVIMLFFGIVCMSTTTASIDLVRKNAGYQPPLWMSALAGLGMTYGWTLGGLAVFVLLVIMSAMTSPWLTVIGVTLSVISWVLSIIALLPEEDRPRISTKNIDRLVKVVI